MSIEQTTGPAEYFAGQIKNIKEGRTLLLHNPWSLLRPVKSLQHLLAGWTRLDYLNALLDGPEEGLYSETALRILQTSITRDKEYITLAEQRGNSDKVYLEDLSQAEAALDTLQKERSRRGLDLQ